MPPYLNPGAKRYQSPHLRTRTLALDLRVMDSTAIVCETTSLLYLTSRGGNIRRAVMENPSAPWWRFQKLAEAESTMQKTVVLTTALFNTIRTGRT